MIFVLAQSTPSELSSHIYVSFIILMIKKGAEWGAPFEKLEERQNNKVSNVTLTEDLLLNYDDLDKDLNKNKNLLEENKKVFDQIGKIIQDLKGLHTETALLHEKLNNRQNTIIEKVRLCVGVKIKELMPEGNNQIAYDEDDMKTGSSPSSVEDLPENELENEKSQGD